MSLSFQVTLQPWFTRLLASLGPVHLNAGISDTTLDGLCGSNQVQQTLPPLNMLTQLGFCGCNMPTSCINACGTSVTDHNGVFEDVTGNHKPDTSSVNVTTNEASKSADLDFPDVSKTMCKDQELFDSHPHREIYVTNPKTGREIKKLVCLVEG